MQPSYKEGAREILQVASAMHNSMVYENQSKQTVLREYMSCGWGAWRPQGGQLTAASAQTWAKRFSEESMRSSHARASETQWVDEDMKPILPKKFRVV